MAAGLLVVDAAGADGAPVGVRQLILSHPARRNAVDPGVLGRIVEELARAAREGVRALVLSGEGGTFCSGYDLTALPERAAPEGDLPDAPLVRACEAVASAPLPVVAAIDGSAFGAGCELACACDLRVASPTARFALPPAKLGIVYSPEGTERVERLIGLSQARRLFFTAAVIGAAEAHHLGLCEELVEASSALPRALALAGELAALSPVSLSGMKRTFALLQPALSAEARLELDRIRRASFSSEDAREGRAAFLAKRPARFPGR
jgi:enoyl-CoA hydratase/carnithine racemase